MAVARSAGDRGSVENLTSGLIQEDLRDVYVQEKFIKEYLNDYQPSEDTLKKIYEMNKKYNKGDIICVEDGGEGLNLDEYLDLPNEFKTQVGVDVSKSSKEVKHDFSNLNEDFNLEAA